METLTGTKRWWAVGTLYFVSLCDYLSKTIVIILFATLLVAPDSPLVGKETGLGLRHFYYGLLLTIHPLAVILMAPVWGALSDRFGRRPTLTVTTLVAAGAYAILGYGVSVGSIAILTVGQGLSGLAAGNLPIVAAGLSDLTTPKNRGRYMSIFAVIYGVAWVAGPLMGAYLADKRLVSWFSPSLPFWTLGLFYIGACLFVLFAALETNTTPDRTRGVIATVRSFGTMFRMPGVGRLFMIFSAVLVGHVLFTYFFAIYLSERYLLDERHVNETYAYAAVWRGVGGVVANQIFRFFSASKLVFIPMVALACACMAYLLIDAPVHLLWLIPIAAIAMAFIESSFFTLLANSVAPEMRGKIFGAWQSVRSFAYIVIPLIALWFALIWINLPNLIGGVFVLGAAIWYVLSRRRLQNDNAHGH